MTDVQKELDPILIFAPSARCGITVLQRLLNSTGKIIIYGENSLLINTMPQQLIHLPATADQHRQARQRLIAGEYDFWSSAIWPDVGRYCQATVQAIKLLLKNYQCAAAGDGFAHWGIKNPLNDGRFAAFFHQTFPASKIIFIYRHIVDVARSYKARKWLDNEQKLADVVKRWCQILSYMLGSDDDDRLMKIRYEDLVARPAEHAQRLEDFVGVAGIDRTVFGKKINTFTGPIGRGYSPTQYIEPEDLTGREIQIIRSLATDLLTRCRYLPPTPVSMPPVRRRPPRDHTRQRPLHSPAGPV